MSIINKARYFAIQFKVAIELGLANAGKEGVCPTTTPNGIKVLDASAELQGPDARAFGSKVPLALRGLESTVVVTRKLASCTILMLCCYMKKVMLFWTLCLSVVGLCSVLN